MARHRSILMAAKDRRDIKPKLYPNRVLNNQVIQSNCRNLTMLATKWTIATVCTTPPISRSEKARLQSRNLDGVWREGVLKTVNKIIVLRRLADTAVNPCRMMVSAVNSMSYSINALGFSWQASVTILVYVPRTKLASFFTIRWTCYSFFNSLFDCLNRFIFAH